MESAGTAGDLRKFLLEMLPIKSLMSSIVNDRCMYSDPPESLPAVKVSTDAASPAIDSAFKASRSLYVTLYTLVEIYRPNNRLQVRSPLPLGQSQIGQAQPSGDKQIAYDGPVLDMLGKVSNSNQYLHKQAYLVPIISYNNGVICHFCFEILYFVLWLYLYYYLIIVMLYHYSATHLMNTFPDV